MKYPPFTRLVMFKIAGKDHIETKRHAAFMGKSVSDILNTQPQFQSITLMGPIESAIYKIANQYRWQLILKGSDTKTLHMLLDYVQNCQKVLFTNPKVKVSIDVDPIFMM